MRKRKRLPLLLLLPLLIAAALATRREEASFLPEFVVRFGGDTLWASATYVLLALLRPSAPPFELFLTTVVLAVIVETSQLIQAEWLVRLRHTFPFGYLLGYGFLWSDLLCYTAGAFLAYIPDRLIRERRDS